MSGDGRKRTPTPRHPARFSDLALEKLAQLVPAGGRLLDPFAGTGRIHQLVGVLTVGVELEPEWAAMHPRTLVGDALALPFTTDAFDCIATSPPYGNRLADHHEARDGSTRRSYRHDLGRPLHPNNSGAEQWGPRYQEMLECSWHEAVRVLRPSGTFLLVISDHVRVGRIQPVTDWHLATLQALGLQLRESHEVPTRRLRYGANADARMASETVAFLVKPDTFQRAQRNTSKDSQ